MSNETRITLAEKQLESGFSAQERQYLLLILNGSEPLTAAKTVGASVPQLFVQKMAADTRAQAVLEHAPAHQDQKVEITRDMLNVMLLSSHSRAVTATEEIMAIRELGKMNDLYADAKHKGTKIVNNVGGTHVNVTPGAKQIASMSDEQLMEMAGEAITLSPEDYHAVEDTTDEQHHTLSAPDSSERPQDPGEIPRGREAADSGD